MEITKIVLTGGPSAGKTSAISRIQSFFAAKGYDDYALLFVPETATELISNGVAPWSFGENLSYQKCQMELQLAKERVFEKAASMMDKEKALIICDRGALDNRAYMSDGEFRSLLTAMGLNEVTLRDGYDAVFHLVTAAKGAEQFYTTANNVARTEGLQQAVELDERVLSAWTGHPHLRVIDNSTDFETKLRRLIAEICAFLGEPEPFEVERKYLIRYPDIQWLESLPNCQRVEIIQTYLNSSGEDELRVRQRGADGNYIYYLTNKRRVSDVKRVEVERRLSKDEYLRLLMNADTGRRQIRKTRYCLMYDNQYFEIDVYPFWQDRAIMEIELCDENAQIVFPPQLQVIKEVTEDLRYSNSALAEGLPEE